MTECLCPLCIRLMTNESLLAVSTLWEAGRTQKDMGPIHHSSIQGVLIWIPSWCPLWGVRQGKKTHSDANRAVCLVPACLSPTRRRIIASFSLGGNWLCLETFEHPIKLISFANESDNTEHFKVKFPWAFHLAGLWGNGPALPLLIRP